MKEGVLVIERKKMYKSGKHWVVATVVASSLLAGTNAVSADQNDTVTAKDTPQVEMSVAKTQSDEVELTTQADQKEVTNDSDIQSGAEKNISEAQETTSSNVTDTSKDEAQLASSVQASVPEQTEKVDTTVGVENSKDATSVNNEVTTASETKISTTAKLATQNSDKTTSAVTKIEATVKNESTRPTLNETAQKIADEAKLNTNDLTDEQINALNKVIVDDSNGTKMTYKNFEDIANALINQDSRYAIPYFNASQIKNMPAAYTRDAETGEYADLDIWDSWPVQDAQTGYVSNWNGYQLVIAMMGRPGYEDNHLYLLYNKYGDNDFSHWKNAGSIFGYNETPDIQEWSGSAIVNKDNSIQLFYTKNNTGNGRHNDQRVATATIYLDHNNNEVSIAKVENDRVIFSGDGYHYQTYDQWANHKTFDDDFTLRDSHVVEDENGDRYLVFEANTGMQDYQGEHQIYKWSNYGGDAAFNTNSFFNILSNADKKSRAKWANAAIGILKLTNDQKRPEVETIFDPLVTAPMVSDEIERPNVVKLGDKYYLFAASRLTRGVDTDLITKANQTVGDNVIMLGYVSDNLKSGYRPLNSSGVVLTASVPANWRTATYSYYAVPVEGYSDRVLVTAYMTNRGEVAGEGKNSTWSPSFLVQINPDGTTQVLAKMTNQGDWIWDDSSENPEMMGTLETAALPGEREKPVDWDLIGYGLKPHTPAKPTEPTNPSVPEVPTTPETPSDPEVPTTPETPSNPEVPTTPETPSVPEVPTTPETPVVPDKYVVPTEPTSHVAKDTQTELPQLNEEKGGSLAMLAAGMSAVLMGLGLRSTKKRRSN
ncbi:glycoside hydrolase family 68 protein [Ligilactobacillus faecis]|uniref:glycoside hydrolase family 68 protein n=1 Tax=Ligilactobacillus faecis TaxID=762833 RepID=UPI0024697F14|nr:glycoside hydrolase family 68 protein [Ligilactobacillus faecis]WGN90082.1 glycoside hydrolase family 68 protein [Ligilactobacillus faecis]